jgi:hypothetical protein
VGELVAGFLMALVAIGLVLEPLFRAGRRSAAPVDSEDPDLGDPAESESPKVQALVALREIEFDRATGKLADEDYLRLKAKFENRALEAIRAEEAGAPRVTRPVADRAEDAVRRAKQHGQRVCPSCGPRPEANAVFCSRCGRSLMGKASATRCTLCGEALPEGARFCAMCGGTIAA